GRLRGALGRLARRYVELEGHAFAHEHPAGFEGGVPLEAPLLAVDRDRTREADADVAPRVDDGTDVFALERDRLRDAPDRQLTADPVVLLVERFDRRRLERDLGILVHREEIVASQVRVAVGVAGVNA